MTIPDPRAGTDDLLRPTLTVEDDESGFDCPWSPMALVFVAFFGGLPAGGGLLALNFRRLGRPERVAPAMVLVVILTILVVAVGGYLAASKAGAADRSTSQYFRLGARAFAVVVSLALAASQAKRYRLFSQSDRPKGKLLVPIIAAIAVGWAATAAGIILFTLFFRSAMEVGA
jgi:heme A synthase